MTSTYTGIYVLKRDQAVVEVQVVDSDGEASSLTVESYDARRIQPPKDQLPEKSDYFDKLDMGKGQDD
ncbi:hypothetical protein [Salinicola aestuarinus]|uniref:hypothetical protein n=1 Tax=Salinicola aestuarinus TaxID=1949082 RepID=UPI000DA13697|nr:hypothetical protein [Salinicola aestuarinus]